MCYLHADKGTRVVAGMHKSFHTGNPFYVVFAVYITVSAAIEESPKGKTTTGCTLREDDVLRGVPRLLPYRQPRDAPPKGKKPRDAPPKGKTPRDAPSGKTAGCTFREDDGMHLPGRRRRPWFHGYQGVACAVLGRYLQVPDIQVLSAVGKALIRGVAAQISNLSANRETTAAHLPGRRGDVRYGKTTGCTLREDHGMGCTGSLPQGQPLKKGSSAWFL